VLWYESLLDDVYEKGFVEVEGVFVFCSGGSDLGFGLRYKKPRRMCFGEKFVIFHGE